MIARAFDRMEVDPFLAVELLGSTEALGRNWGGQGKLSEKWQGVPLPFSA